MPSLDAKERAVLLKQATEHGARVEQRGNGHIIFPPDGSKMLTLHSSVSDSNGWRVFRQHWRQAGLGPWPWDGYTAPKEQETEVSIPNGGKRGKYADVSRKLDQYLAEHPEIERTKSKPLADLTGGHQASIGKYLIKRGWVKVGDRSTAEWVRPRSVRVMVEQPPTLVEHEEAHPVEYVEEPSVLDRSIEEHLAEDAPEVTEDYQLGEAAGYEQAHNELMPKIDKLSEELDVARRGVDDLLTERKELAQRLDEALRNIAELERQSEVTRNQLRDAVAERNHVEALVHDGTWEFRDDLITGSTMLADLREMIAAAGLEYEIRVWRMDGKV